MKKRAITICLALLLVAGCSDSSGSKGRPIERGTLDREGAVIPVEIMEVQEQDVVEWIRGVGSVSADKSVTLAAEVGARVAETLVDVGDLVKEGDVLAKLDNERLRIARDLAKAEVDIARSNLEDARRDARRQADLFEDGIISKEMSEESDLDVDVFAGQLEMAEAKLAVAERDLSDATIRSPIQGEITRRYIEVGELIQPGTPVFDIADIRRVKIDVNISEREITRIRKGQPAEIDVDGYPGVTFRGKIHTIGAEADRLTRNFPVEILVINDRPEKLLPGFIGRVRIRGRVFENAIFLPKEVIVERDGKPTVYIAASDKVSERSVVLGFQDRGKILVSEGLRPGDKLVVTGQENLVDGSKIIIR